MDDMTRYLNETPPRGCMTMEFTKPFAHGWDAVKDRDDRKETVDRTPPIIEQAVTEQPSVQREVDETPFAITKDERTLAPDGDKKNWWSIPNVKAYLIFQPLPKCFTAPEWAEWKTYAALALTGTGARCSGKTSLPPHCGDCMPKFQSLMKASGRCTHPEVKFKEGKAYVPRKCHC